MKPSEAVGPGSTSPLGLVYMPVSAAHSGPGGQAVGQKVSSDPAERQLGMCVKVRDVNCVLTPMNHV